MTDNSPINLIGRHLLFKLRAIIHCTPDGLFLTFPEDKAAPAYQLLMSFLVAQ